MRSRGAFLKFVVPAIVAVGLALAGYPARPQILSAEPRAGVSPTGAGLGYGIIVSNLNNLDRVQQDLQFNWIKYGLAWKYAEPSKGVYSWAGLDDVVTQVRARGLKLLVRVDDPPVWATGTTAFNAPPINDQDLADFMAALASRYRGRIQAYEIWNEPNLSTEWGGQNPSPAKFARMLRALYPRVKAADPLAKVVTGGLSNVGDGNGTTVYADLLYIKYLYDPNGDGNLSDGAKGYFDALGSHPYGGPNPPEQDPWNPPPPTGTYFRRAWQHNQMTKVWGGEDKEIWATEFGWVLNPAEEGRNCDAVFGPHFAAMKVSADQQAQYTVRAFEYAQQNWPWMGVMILMNLDMAGDWWRDPCEVVRYQSILNASPSRTPVYSPRSVYDALRNMPKPGILPVTLSLNNSVVNFLVEPGGPALQSRTLQITNAGDGVLSFSASSSDSSWLTVSPGNGAAPATLTITANTSGLSSGSYRRGTVNISSSGNQQSTPVSVVVYYGPVRRVSLPTIAMGSSGP